MKKILALILALVMVVGLCACGDNGGDKPATGNTDKPAAGQTGNTGAATFDDVEKDTSKPYPNCNEDGSINLDDIAHFDPEYDYTQNEKMKFVYLSLSGGPLYEQSAMAYEYWCPNFNLEWAGYINANGDSDLYMTSLQTQIDNGVRLFVLDPDSTMFPTIKALLDKYPDVYWMSQMAAPRDGTGVGDGSDGIPVGGHMVNNYVGFDNVAAGREVADASIKWMKETYPDVSFDEVGFLMADYSISPPLHERAIGSKQAWLEAGGKEENFVTADLVSYSLTLQGGLDGIGPVIATHPEIQYWCGNGLFDDIAMATASIFDQQGLTDTSCVAVFGGSGLVQQWEAGQQDAFRFAIFTAQNLYAEPILGAVYAYAMGWATPDSIWPSWVKYDDKGADGHTYSQLRLPTEPLTYETYRTYLAWTDLVSRSNMYGFPTDGIAEDAFTKFVAEVPADYNP